MASIYDEFKKEMKKYKLLANVVTKDGKKYVVDKPGMPVIQQATVLLIVEKLIKEGKIS